MRKLISCLLIVFLSFGLIINEASAKRFGGGRSFGVQRSSSFFKSSPTQNTKSFGQNTNKGKWGGVLGGLLVGGLLASLFMGHGLGSGLLSWLIVGSLLFFVIGFLRKRMQPGFQPASGNNFRANPFNHSSNAYAQQGGSSQVPVGFNEETFLRDAKVKFLRLQTAYDQKNLSDLNEFTAPEIFAEIQMQLEERGDEPNHTEVSNLNAELLDVSPQADSTLATVRFSGSVKENNEPMINLNEIWHFRQFSPEGAWVVGGIQQV